VDAGALFAVATGAGVAPGTPDADTAGCGMPELLGSDAEASAAVGELELLAELGAAVLGSLGEVRSAPGGAEAGAVTVEGASFAASEAAALTSTSDLLSFGATGAACAVTDKIETAARVLQQCNKPECIVLLVTGLFQTRGTYNRAPFELGRRAMGCSC